MTRLTGRDAIEYAEKHGLSLSKYADPIEDGRNGLTIDEAEDVLREDPGLIYLDVVWDACESCREGGIIREATTHSKNPEFISYLLCEECAAEYDSRMEPEPKPIVHEVRGSNFHGAYLIRLRGPAEGFELSDAQERKVAETLCGLGGCSCTGVGQKFAEDSARIVRRGWDATCLVPAGADTNDEFRVA